jgi:hypothetical protein
MTLEGMAPTGQEAGGPQSQSGRGGVFIVIGFHNVTKTQGKDKVKEGKPFHG